MTWIALVAAVAAVASAVFAGLQALKARGSEKRAAASADRTAEALERANELAARPPWSDVSMDPNGAYTSMNISGRDIMVLGPAREGVPEGSVRTAWLLDDVPVLVRYGEVVRVGTFRGIRRQITHIDIAWRFIDEDEVREFRFRV